MTKEKFNLKNEIKKSLILSLIIIFFVLCCSFALSTEINYTKYDFNTFNGTYYDFDSASTYTPFSSNTTNLYLNVGTFNIVEGSNVGVFKYLQTAIPNNVTEHYITFNISFNGGSPISSTNYFWGSQALTDGDEKSGLNCHDNGDLYDDTGGLLIIGGCLETNSKNITIFENETNKMYDFYYDGTYIDTRSFKSNINPHMNSFEFATYGNLGTLNISITNFRVYSIEAGAPPEINNTPIQELTSPLNNSIFNNDTTNIYLNFTYLHQNASNSDECILYVNGIDEQLTFNQTNNTQNSYNKSVNTNTTYNWFVFCNDSLNHNYTTNTWTFHINETPIIIPPVIFNSSINLILPFNNKAFVFNTSLINFEYQIISNETGYNCSLLINNMLNISDISLNYNNTINHNITFNESGLYNWRVNCGFINSSVYDFTISNLEVTKSITEVPYEQIIVLLIGLILLAVGEWKKNWFIRLVSGLMIMIYSVKTFATSNYYLYACILGALGLYLIIRAIMLYMFNSQQKEDEY